MACGHEASETAACRYDCLVFLKHFKIRRPAEIIHRKSSSNATAFRCRKIAVTGADIVCAYYFISSFIEAKLRVLPRSGDTISRNHENVSPISGVPTAGKCREAALFGIRRVMSGRHSKSVPFYGGGGHRFCSDRVNFTFDVY